MEGPGLRVGGAALILGLETSCDETAAALISAEGQIRSNVVSSQADLHARFGGVVPEVASRRHLELVLPVVREALAEADASLDDVETVAVTQGPGLIGALLVGLAAAKALAWGRGLPLVPVNHLHGHVASLYLEPEPLEPPFLCLLASGGHTMLVDVQERGGFRPIGTTLDDAAGEAFDKGARLLGLGYPGGAELDRLAREGDPDAYSFPVARVPGLDFSFSGVKTALLYEVREGELEARRADLAASYQRAIVRALDAANARGRRADRRRADRDRGRSGCELGASGRPGGCRRAAASALHRQRRDDRLRRPLYRGDPLTRLSWARCLFLGCLRQDVRHRPRSSRWRRRCSWSASGSAARKSARSSRKPRPGAVSSVAPTRRSTSASASSSF